MLSTPPCFRRASSSEVGVACGTTPQNVPGTAPAVAAVAPPVNTANASATANARTFIPIGRFPGPRIGLARFRGDGSAGLAGVPPWRRWRIRTTAREIAARTAIAIRIGTSGEEPPPSLFCGAGYRSERLLRVAGLLAGAGVAWATLLAGAATAARVPGAEDFEDGWFPPEPETMLFLPPPPPPDCGEVAATAGGGRLARRGPRVAAAAGAAGSAAAGTADGGRRGVRVLRRRVGVRERRKAGQCQQSQH